jgi:short-subunit dehydrogenase
MKTVLITGASRGIGFALANLFVQNNYYVIGTSRSSFDSTSLLDANMEMLQLDLADSKSIKQFEQHIKERQIKIDILINNAAIGPDLDTAIPIEKLLRETFDTNIIGTVLLTSHY